MSAKTTPADVQVPARDIRFDLSSAKNGHWLAGDPVGTAVFNALSLTFPEGERMFMDAVKNYRKDLSGKLADDVRGFIAQEAIHSREHHQLNILIDRERYPVAEIEAAVKERTGLARAQGPMTMLVSTIALEHFTAMMADVHAENMSFFDGVSPEIERLWRWHAMEETEHKGVAFDVFMHATRDWSPMKRYLRRVISMAVITYLFTSNITTYAARLLEADGYSPAEARKAVKKFVWREPGIFSKGWKTYFSWYRPGFHPWDHDNRALIARWKQDFAVPVGVGG
ncbi:MAG: metal-dependent hydrolase [Micropepsaceae bacterium]